VADFSLTDFTGTNGDPWTDHGFARVEGNATYPPPIWANAGRAHASVGSAWRLLADARPGRANYAANVSLVWKNAAGAGRYAELAVRCSDDGQNGYYATLDSNIGTPRIRLRRRVAGAFTDLIAWTNLSVVTPANMNAGVALYLSAEESDGAVDLVLRVASEEFTFSDTDAARLGGPGGVILGLDANSLDDDVIYDNLILRDFADEYAGPGTLGTGTFLVVNGRYLSESEFSALGIVLVKARRSYGTEASVVLRDLNRFTEPALVPGAEVAVIRNGVWLASGFLRAATGNLTPSTEGSEYEVCSRKELAQDVPIVDPDTNEGTVSFNLPTGHAQYRADRSGKTLGQIIEWIVANHEAGSGGLRDVGAAPASGTVIPAGVAALDAVKPSITISGNVHDAIEALLRYAPSYGWDVDPETQEWAFLDRSAGAATTIALATRHVTGRISTLPRANYTAVLIRGQYRPPISTIRLSAGDLSSAWDPALEALWNSSDRFKARATGVVNGTGVGGGGEMIVVPTAALVSETNEWAPNVLVFTSGAENGNRYTIKSNGNGAGGQITLDAVAWQGAGPAPGDTFQIVEDEADGNGFSEVFRSFNITDPTVGVGNVACVTARIVNADPSDPARFTIEEAHARIEKMIDDSLGTVTGTPNATYHKVTLDRPAVKPGEAACDDGGMTVAHDVELDLPKFTVDPGAPDAVPMLRVPSTGFRGTAYSYDPALWNGGGAPRYGDPGVRRVLVIDDPNYGGTSEDAEYTKIADAILDVYGTIAEQGEFVIANELDTDYARLDRIVTIDPSPRTAVARASNLWEIAAEWDFVAKTTTVFCGTVASFGGFDVEAARSAAADTTRADELRRTQEQMLSLYECLKETLKGTTASGGQPGLASICSDQVVTPGPGGGPVTDALADQESCSANGVLPAVTCTPACTVIVGVGQAQTNAAFANSITVHGDQTKALRDKVAGLGGTNYEILAVVCWLCGQVAALWQSLAGASAALDAELAKVRADGTNLISSISAMLATITNAFTAVSTNFTTVQTEIQCLDNKIGTLCSCLFVNDNVLATAIAQRALGMSSKPTITNCCESLYACQQTLNPIPGLSFSWSPTTCDPASCVFTFPAISAPPNPA
jgi:hypothetical protein